MLFGIDTSSWQTDLNLGSIAYDFIVEKATEGSAYVNPDCDTKIQAAQDAGKKFGVYHFAGHTDAVAEADYFVNNCLGYIGKGIIALDWEGEFVADVAWAKKWLDRVYERTGVKPLIYMSEWVENNYNWSSVVKADYGLWIAKYSDYEIDRNYDTSNAGTEPAVTSWPFYIMWQYTSVGRLNGYGANLDVDIFYGDGGVWDAYARPNTPNPDPTPAPPVIIVPVPIPVDPTPVPVPDPGTIITPDPAQPGEDPVPVVDPPAPVPSDNNNPVRPKVKWAAIAGAVLSFILALIGFIQSSPGMLQGSAYAIATTLITFAVGYLKRDGLSPK